MTFGPIYVLFGIGHDQSHEDVCGHDQEMYVVTNTKDCGQGHTGQVLGLLPDIGQVLEKYGNKSNGGV
jgi:hypothetical protein